MIDPARLWQLVMFAVLALVSYIVFERYFNPSSGNAYKPFTKGYALIGVTITSTDDDGNITTTIASPAVTHYADTEKTIIEEPEIQLHGTTDNWLFTSAIGEINPNRTEIFFPEKVAVKLLGDEQEKIDIDTRALKVDVIEKIGTTAAAFQIKQTGSLMTSVGAEIKFNQQEINLLSEMYAEFEN